MPKINPVAYAGGSRLKITTSAANAKNGTNMLNVSQKMFESGNLTYEKMTDFSSKYDSSYDDVYVIKNGESIIGFTNGNELILEDSAADILDTTAESASSTVPAEIIMVDNVDNSKADEVKEAAVEATATQGTTIAESVAEEIKETNYEETAAEVLDKPAESVVTPEIIETPKVEEKTELQEALDSMQYAPDESPIIFGGATSVDLSSVAQSGISINRENYDINWNAGTRQLLLYDYWVNHGKQSKDGIAIINGRYVVAVTTLYGKVGDYIDVVLKDGTVIPAIIGDAKGPDSAGNQYGHFLQMPDGSLKPDIIEWCTAGKQSNETLRTATDGLRGIGVSQVINLGKTQV